MWQYNHTNELYHWGVKGMKWGVRKNRRKEKYAQRQARIEEQWNNFTKGQKIAAVVSTPARVMVRMSVATAAATAIVVTGKAAVRTFMR